MITASQLRAGRALLGIDQRDLARRARLALPTIQRMESGGGLIRGNIDALVKVVQLLKDRGIELIGEGGRAPSVAAAFGYVNEKCARPEGKKRRIFGIVSLR